MWAGGNGDASTVTLMVRRYNRSFATKRAGAAPFAAHRKAPSEFAVGRLDGAQRDEEDSDV